MAVRLVRSAWWHTWEGSHAAKKGKSAKANMEAVWFLSEFALIQAESSNCEKDRLKASFIAVLLMMKQDRNFKVCWFQTHTGIQVYTWVRWEACKALQTTPKTKETASCVQRSMSFELMKSRVSPRHHKTMLGEKGEKGRNEAKVGKTSLLSSDRLQESTEVHNRHCQYCHWLHDSANSRSHGLATEMRAEMIIMAFHLCFSVLDTGQSNFSHS
jgi:hypothetical protein